MLFRSVSQSRYGNFGAEVDVVRCAYLGVMVLFVEVIVEKFVRKLVLYIYDVMWTLK